MSPKSRVRKQKKSGSPKRTGKRSSPASGQTIAAVADPGYGGLGFELSRWALDDFAPRSVQPDGFGPSHQRVLAASAALLRSDGPRALEQATAELIGTELRSLDVQGLRFDLWAYDLIESAHNRVLSDVAWNNDTWQGPWWLLHGLASIGSYGLGRHAALQAAQAAKSLPPAALAQQPDWLPLMPDIEATGDVLVVRDVYGTRFGVIAGFAYPGGVDPSVCLVVLMPTSTSAWPSSASSTTPSRRSPRGATRSSTVRRARSRSLRKCWPGCRTRSTPTC